MKKVVLIRHGESDWNRENRFTGWTDVGLSEKGIQEAVEAGKTVFFVPLALAMAKQNEPLHASISS